MKKKLSELLPGEKGIIKGIEKRAPYRERLMEMGLTVGGQVMMRRDAPMGDPLELFVMGYNISLRKSEAKHIIIEVVNESGQGF
jgi:Fe2+ transport system protein FeoA